jgi:copper chaperone CopZ
MKSITLKIEGMHCDGCAATLKALLGREPGVKTASVSFDTGEARITYDPAAVDEKKLIAAAERPGYRVVAETP